MARQSKIFKEEIGKYLEYGVTEAERIAKEIGGHIPERVEDEHIPNDEKILEIPKFKQKIQISLEEYTALIEENGYLKGKNREIEKQLEELRKPVEYVKLENEDEKEYMTIKRGEITE